MSASVLVPLPVGPTSATRSPPPPLNLEGDVTEHTGQLRPIAKRHVVETDRLGKRRPFHRRLVALLGRLIEQVEQDAQGGCMVLQLREIGVGLLRGGQQPLGSKRKRPEHTGREEEREQQEQLAGSRVAERLGDAPNPRLLPNSGRVGKHAEKRHERRQAHDLGEAAGDHHQQRHADLPAAGGAQMRP
jgi:hypothetical protein